MLSVRPSAGTRWLPLVLAWLMAPTAAAGREGLFLRLGLGPGIAAETSSVQSVGIALTGKDHAIGYGLTEGFALQVTDFGALVKMKIGEFDYLNLDAFGLGAVVTLPGDALASFSAGWGQVAFARDWWEATGTDVVRGPALNAAVRREWRFGARWGLAAGAVASFFRTLDRNLAFFNVGFVGSATFYLSPR